MRSFIEIYRNPIPGCNPCPDQYFCDSYVRCIIQTDTEDVYPTGGCSMGFANDTNAVVDERMRVFGVTGLRVIDSSVMPVGTEQSQGPTIMIAEYGADMIKKDNHYMNQ